VQGLAQLLATEVVQVALVQERLLALPLAVRKMEDHWLEIQLVPRHLRELQRFYFDLQPKRELSPKVCSWNA
jgi:hypothetical protein